MPYHLPALYGQRSASSSNAGPPLFPTMRSSSPSSPVAESNTIARAARSSNQRPTFEPAASSRQTAPMPSSAQSSSARNHKSTGKPPSPFKKEIKHHMHLDYLRTGRGRPHIDW